MLVSCVHPVAIPRAVPCTIRSLSMFVSDAPGDRRPRMWSVAQSQAAVGCLRCRC